MNRGLAFSARNRNAVALLQDTSLDCKGCTRQIILGVFVAIISLVFVASVLGGFCAVQYNTPAEDSAVFRFENETQKDGGRDNNSPNGPTNSPIIDVTKATQSPSIPPSLRLPAPTTAPVLIPSPTVPMLKPAPVISNISCPCFDLSDINILIHDVLPIESNKLDEVKSCKDKSGSKYGVYYMRYTADGFNIDSKGFGVVIRKDHNTCHIEGRSSGMTLQITHQEGAACHSLIEQACDDIE